MSFRVEIKPSARRANGAVGVELNHRGARRAFESRAAAESWAADLSDRGERRVWIHRAHPLDDSPADAYLVSRRPGGAEAALAGAYDKRRRRLCGDDGGEQSGLTAFGNG